MPRDDFDYNDYSDIDEYYGRKRLCAHCAPRRCPPMPCQCCCIGPTGPQGDCGEKGETGAAGSKGDCGDKGERGAAGPKGEAGAKGERGAAGPKGEAGARGEKGDAGARGERGEAGQEGRAGATGPKGDRGPIASTIPFSISSISYGGGVEISTDDAGNPLLINFAGFGATDSTQPVQLQPGDWERGAFSILQNISYPESFIMPFDATLRNIYGMFANREPLYLEAEVIMRPFICIAVLLGESLEFSILRETITIAAPFVGGEEIPKYTLRKGSLKGISVPIAEGTPVGIVIGCMCEGMPLENSARVSISGGLFLD